MLKQQINFVNIDPGILAGTAVSDHSIENAVQNNQHPNGKKLLAEIADIIAEDSGVGIYIGGLGESIQTALGEQLDCQSHIAGLWLRLPEQLCVEILKCGDSPPIAAADIAVINLGSTAVNDGLFFCGELSGADKLFTQRQKKFGLQHHRILPITVALLHIKGVDVIWRNRGNIDYFSP